MANNVAQFTGISSIPTQFSSQRNFDDTITGIKWCGLIDDAAESGTDGKLKFYFSIDGGVTWQEDTSERIDDVYVPGGVDFEIASRADGEERIICTYIRHNVVHVAFGKLRSDKKSFFWLREGVHASSTSSSWRYPSIRCIPLSSNWWVHTSWAKQSSGKVYVYLQLIKFYSWDSYSKNYERYTYSVSSNNYSRMCWGHRHLGEKDKINSGQPDVFLSWFTGLSGDSSSSRKCFKRKFSYTGSGWKEETLRTIRQETVNASLIDAVSTGRTFCTVLVPLEDTNNIEMHLMNYSDTERQAIDITPLGQGVIKNLGVTWDSWTGDIWIVASGATSNILRYIVYDWIAKTFSNWTQVNSDVVLAESLSLKEGSRHNLIEGIYCTDVGGNSQVRWELFGVTNLAPTQPPIVTTSGPYDINSQFILEWIHTDLDGDPQVRFAVRRTNAAETGFEHWTGTTWQASFTSVTSSVQSITFAAGWQTDEVTKEYQVQTYDGQLWSEWSNPIIVTGSIPVDPTIATPNNSINDPETIISPQLTMTWTVTEQLAYLAEILTPLGAVVYSSGWIPDSVTREFEFFNPPIGAPFLLVNVEDYVIRITTQNNEGLISTPDTVNITALFDPPPLPVFHVVPVLDSRSFLLTIENPAPTGNQPLTDHNNIYIQIENDGIWKRIGAAIEPNIPFKYYPGHGLDTEFMVESVSAAGAINQAT